MIKHLTHRCNNCGSSYPDYEVLDEVWAATEDQHYKFLCIPCLENILKRFVTIRDLKECPTTNLMRQGISIYEHSAENIIYCQYGSRGECQPMEDGSTPCTPLTGCIRHTNFETARKNLLKYAKLIKEDDLPTV